MLIHIGYHKTGTTYLQTGLFSSRESGFISPWAQTDIRRLMVLCSDFEWSARATQREFLAGLAGTDTDGCTRVMSDERLSGAPHAGGYDSARTAHRLADVFPDARILIGIREQTDAVYSTYLQYVRNGGSAPLRKYLAPRHQAEVPQFRFEHWEYHHLIALYQQLFGIDRVLVLAYEHLRTDADSWTRQICKLLDVPSVSAVAGHRYSALSATGLEVKRQANRLLFRGALNPSAPLYVRNLESRFEGVDHLWPAVLSDRIARRNREIVRSATAGRYGRSNKQTEALTGIDLDVFGYDRQT